MKNKVTKSFALDEISIELISELKKHLNLKNDSEVVTFALFDLSLDKNVHDIKQHIDKEIARRNYYKVLENSYNDNKNRK